MLERYTRSVRFEDNLKILLIAVCLNMSLKITTMLIMQEIALGIHP